MKTNRIISLLLSLCLIFSIVTPLAPVLANTGGGGATIIGDFATVQVIGFDRTIVAQVPVAIETSPFDLTQYGVTTPATGYTALHAVIKALTDAGIDCKSPDQFTCSPDGGFVSKVAGLASFDMGGGSGWMFNVNDTMPWDSIGQYLLMPYDKVVLYYSQHWNDCHHANFDETSKNVQINKPLNITLRQMLLDENWNAYMSPVNGAAITINNADSAYTTDANGVATLTFSAAGTYKLSAKLPGMVDGQNGNTLTYAYCTVTVTTTPPAQTTPKLSGLSLTTNGTITKAMQSFSPQNTGYTMELTRDTTDIDITATCDTPGTAIILVYHDGSDEHIVALNSGLPQHLADCINADLTNINITVISPDTAMRNTYNVEITRSSINTQAKLQSISLTGGYIKNAFNPLSGNIEGRIYHDTAITTLTVTPSSPASYISIETPSGTQTAQPGQPLNMDIDLPPDINSLTLTINVHTSIDQTHNAQSTYWLELVRLDPLSPYDNDLYDIFSDLSQKYIDNKTTDDWTLADLKACGVIESVDTAALAAYVQNTTKLLKTESVPTEIEKYIIALTAIGIDPRTIPDGNGSTLNLIDKIANTQNLGTVNGYIFALLAYDCGEFDVADTAVWTRQKLIDKIIQSAHSDGGWGLSADSDPDVTAMAVSAIAPYLNTDSAAQTAVDGALTYLSNSQQSDGSFKGSGTWATINSNSTAMVIVALSTLGIDAKSDPRFIKNDTNALTNLLSYKVAGNGFKYMPGDTNANTLATEQAFRALIAYIEFKNGGVDRTYSPYRFGAFIPNTLDKSIKIGLRIEGMGNLDSSPSTMLDQSDMSFVYSTQTANVFETVQKLLDDSGIPYQASNVYFSSIATQNAGFFGGWDGWMYMVNGKSPSVGMGDYILSDGDDILLYYGDFEQTVYPQLAVTKYENGSATIRFTSIDYAGEVSPITHASVVWDKDSTHIFTTDTNGEIIIPPDKALGGKHAVAISKTGTLQKDGKYIPPIVKLADNYTIPLAYQIDVTAANNIVNIPKGDTTPYYITIATGVTNGRIQITNHSGTASTLPQINIIANQSTGGAIAVTIPSNTTVYAYSGWNGRIMLPKTVTASISGAVISKSVLLGFDGEDVSLSQPVRVLIPGAGSASKIGYFNANGALIEITDTLQSDTLDAAKDKLKYDSTSGRTVYDAKTVSGGDMVVWTKRMAVFSAYSGTPANPDDGPGGSTGGTSNKVYIRVSDPKGTTYLQKTSYDFVSGESAVSLLQKTGLSIKVSGGTGNRYIEEIEGLAEFDHGEGSGWEYRVNGSFPAGSGDAYKLKSGDYVEWLYTRDFGKDIGDAASSGSSAATTTAPNNNPEITALNSSITKLKAYLKSMPSSGDSLIYALLPQFGLDNEQTATDMTKAIKAVLYSQTSAFNTAAAILSASAAGINPYDIDGINIVNMLIATQNLTTGDAKTLAAALMAYDAAGIKLTANHANSRSSIKTALTSCQKTDGSFGDISTTAWAVMALSPYSSDNAIKDAINKATAYLSANQKPDGSYNNDAQTTGEVMIAVLVAGISPTDKNFTKTGKTLASALYALQKSDGWFGSNNANISAGFAMSIYLNYLNKKTPLLSLPSKSTPAFLDSPSISQWAQDSSSRLRYMNIMVGDASNNFLPKESLIRAQAAKLLVTLANMPEESIGNTTFADTPPDAWYAPYVLTAANHGIVQGVGGGMFDPHGIITRQDFAVMLTRTLNLAMSATKMPADINNSAEYAKPAVCTLYTMGIMQGENGNFDPTGVITREMAATICDRVLNDIFE